MSSTIEMIKSYLICSDYAAKQIEKALFYNCSASMLQEQFSLSKITAKAIKNNFTYLICPHKQFPTLIECDSAELEARSTAYFAEAEQFQQTQLTKISEHKTMQAVNLLLKEHLEGFKFVSVVFNVKQPTNQQKVYTYKTNLNLVADDLVVVQTHDGKFETVRVVDIDVIPSGDYEYKWIVAKLDLIPFETVKEVEAEVKLILQDNEREKQEKERAKALKKELGPKVVSQVAKVIGRTRI